MKEEFTRLKNDNFRSKSIAAAAIVAVILMTGVQYFHLPNYAYTSAKTNVDRLTKSSLDQVKDGVDEAIEDSAEAKVSEAVDNKF